MDEKLEEVLRAQLGKSKEASASTLATEGAQRDKPDLGPDADGKRADWHNLANQYNSQGQHRKCLAFLLDKLKMFPMDPTLLGDAIRAAGEVAEWETGDRLIESLMTIPTKYWQDWTVAVYANGYYRNRANAAQTPEEREGFLDKAIQVIRAAEEEFTRDELFNADAETLLEANDVEGAKRVLEHAIYDEHPYIDGKSCTIQAPQCCLTYIDSILTCSEDWDRIIQLCDLGIRGDAQEQERARLGYFVYRQALAMDSKILQSEYAKDHQQGLGNVPYVRETVRKYQLANRLIGGDYADVIDHRIDILTTLSDIGKDEGK